MNNDHASTEGPRVPTGSTTFAVNGQSVDSQPGGMSHPGDPADESAGLPPAIPDHRLLCRIGRGSYGEVWLARNVVGAYRAVKIVYRKSFANERPFEREFNGIQKFEPISRSHESQVDILHIGRNEDCFYYVMELADPVTAVTDGKETGNGGGEGRPRGNGEENRTDGKRQLDPGAEPQTTVTSTRPYIPRTLKSEKQGRGRLPFDECLEIGLALTTALAHLHKHGLVHRDIKPSNVIYINGVPKLADIGLVTDADESVSFVGTEGFIPPEGPGSPQADIYGLGKVLYELSTGKDRQDYPEPPTLLGEFEDREQLLELGQIINKACARDLKERYQTAEAMQADLLLLKTGKSVRRTHQLEQRLQLMTRIGAGTLAVMVLGAFPYYLAIREARLAKAAAVNAMAHEQKAKIEAQKSDQVAQFLREMLEGVGPSVARGRDTAILREILDKTARRVGKDLTNQPDVEVELRLTLAAVYGAMGDFASGERMAQTALTIARQSRGESEQVAASLDSLGGFLWRGGKLDQAETMFHDAIQMRKKLLGPEHRSVAESLNNLACVLLDQGHFVEAESTLRAVLPILTKVNGAESRDAVIALDGLAAALSKQGRLAESEATNRQAVALWKQVGGDDDLDGVTSLNNLAMTLRSAGKLGEAESAQREVVALLRKILGNHYGVAGALHNLAAILAEQKRFGDATSVQREALAMYRERLPADHPLLAQCLTQLASILLGQDRTAEAEPLLREGLAIHQKLSPDDVSTFLAQSLLGRILVQQKKFEEAEPVLFAGYRGLRERDSRLSTDAIQFLRNALKSLHELCIATARQEEAVYWMQELDELNSRQADTQPASL